MNKETFNKLVKNPSDVNPQYKKELAQMIASFPYASNLKLLHLSALLNDSDIHFEKELKNTTCHISDRRVLRKIVQQTSQDSDYIIEEPNPHLHIVSAETEDQEKENNLVQSVEKTEIETSIEKPATETKTDPEIQEGLVPELNEQIIASAVHASLSIEAEEIEIPEKEQTVTSVVQGEVQQGKKSFLDWIGAKNEPETVPIADPKAEERIEFRKKAEDLINQFIINQPRIDVKKEFFSPENMAKKSVEDHDTIVTETLAKVYATQGNISKAISTYEQLILKFPEKKSYFASLIKDLKSI